MRDGHADLLVLVLALLPANLAALVLHDHGAVLPDGWLASLVHLFPRDKPLDRLKRCIKLGRCVSS